MATTTTASPAGVTRTVFDALNKKDLDTITALIAHATVDNFVAIGEFRGKPAIGLFFDEPPAASPVFHMTVGGNMSPGESDPEDKMGWDNIECGPSCTAWETSSLVPRR